MADVERHRDGAWWKYGAVYEIYPRSFADSDGDGIGDLRGITAHLDYLVWLGVGAIWIAPVFPSPMADFGYDVADYTGIDARFGTLADFDALLVEARRRDLRVIVDFVPNHTSDQHPWFREARRSRTSEHRDWYIWHDPAADGGPPNNWMSSFGGSAWEWDDPTGQYYYHAFLPQQPDLNWRNPAVQDAMLEVLRFWLDRGVDGFRLDVIWHLIKDAEFRENPPDPRASPDTPEHERLAPLYTTDRPEVHAVIARMRALVDQYDDRVLIGEIYLPTERLVAYYGDEGRGVHLPFNFLLLLLPWRPLDIAAAIEEYERVLPAFGWPNWVLGNHDRPRIASRVGEAQARVAAMLLLTLRGTPTVYYGDEIGMTDVPIAADRVHDPVERRLPGLGLGRDPQRTPMQWDASSGAGFSRGVPWLPLAADHDTRNVEAQRADETSMLTLYRRLLALRREPGLRDGAYAPVAVEGELFAYARTAGASRFLVALNFGSTPLSLRMPDGSRDGTIALSTHLDRTERVERRLDLRPDEGVVVRL